jgi:signal transduction histidine kinase
MSTAVDRMRDRLKGVDPLVIDVAIALGLALLVCAQIFLVSHVRPTDMPIPPGARLARTRPDFGLVPYILAACAFLPLAFRRTVPWLALVLSGAAAAAYSLLPMEPAFVTLGPMIALYSLAAYAKRRHMWLLAFLVVGLVIAVPIIAYSAGVRWVAEVVSTFTLLAAAALLGEVTRNRRDYIAAVEARAAEAERTREEEALRRVDEERVRIAREVHDIVAHSLSIVTVQAAAAEAVLDTDPDQARESLRHIRASGKAALGELRSMLEVLRTGEAESPLAPSADLTHLTALITPVREAGLEVELRTTGDLSAIPAYASVSAYRIVQEALTNVVRHAAATKADVVVEAHSAQLRIEVADDGHGPAAGAERATGHGISGMRERVEALGGTFSAGPVEAGGFVVAATIPISRSS